MKTYVVVGVTDNRYEKDKDILYAGQNEDKAMSLNPDSYHLNLELEVWEKGMLMKRYTKGDIHNWNLVYDRIERTKESIENMRKRMLAAQEELDAIQALLNSDE